MRSFSEEDERYLRQAVSLGRVALGEGELPCAALLVDGQEGKVIGQQYARDRQNHNRISHAELLLLLEAPLERLPRRRLTLYSTLEPCLMCTVALCTEGIGRVVYGLSSPVDGGTYLLEDPQAVRRWGGHVPALVGEVQAEACARLFREFIARPEAPPGMVAFARDVLAGR